jgi:GNAT superfamily N-acetyltransferase
MTLVVGAAAAGDAQSIASMRTAVADDLTAKYGHGHWSFGVTEGSVLEGIRTSCVLIARNDTGIVGTLRLATKRPWAIAREYFARGRRPLYLSDMAVDPRRQRQGIGRRLLEEARTTAGKWPADAIRLDAYDAPAGAGAFYAKCGFREVGRAAYHGVPLVYFELLL